MNCKICGARITDGSPVCELCGSLAETNQSDVKTNRNGLQDTENELLRNKFEDEYGVPPVIDKNTGFGQEWKAEISVLETNQIINAYEATDEYCDEYRYLCYMELYERYKEVNSGNTQADNNELVTMYCRQCGNEIPSDYLYCDMCGTHIYLDDKQCCNCQYIFARNGHYCPKCGKNRNT